jgi:hypothetical protein
MSYKAIYAYPWDVAELGVSAAVDRFLALGLDTVTITGSYHAGKFLRPHGKSGKVYFPEDGTIYFQPDLSRYGAIKPVENSLLSSGKDVIRELVGQSRIATNVWLVLLHNTRLGSAHLDSTVANAFGDRYIYNLCPSAPEARAFAIGLARDVTESYPVSGVSLETPGFLPYAHGYHLEFALNRPNRWLDSQLGLCFCAHCVAGAKSAGIRVEALKRQVGADIEAYLASDADFPADMAEAFWLADVRSDGDLRAYLDWRCSVVTSLVREIRDAVRKDATVAVIPSVARPTGSRGNHRGLLLRAWGRADQSRPVRREAPPARKGPSARHSPPRLPRSGIQRRIPCGDPRARRRRRQRGRVLQLGSCERRESRVDRGGARCPVGRLSLSFFFARL